MEIKTGISQRTKIEKTLVTTPNFAQINTKDTVTGTEIPSPEHPAFHKKWTILSYLAGENNLEPDLVKTVDSLELAGSDDNTHIAAQLDRGSNPYPDPKNDWKNCRRFYVTHDEEKDVLHSQVLADCGPINMADPKTLKNFLVWGIKTYPSDYLAVFLNDHGDGFIGAMHDDSAPPEKPFMTLPDIQWAFDEAEKETGKHVDLLGFNACLMANAETAYQLKDCADYMVASEEVEMSPGWTVDDQYPKVGRQHPKTDVQHPKIGRTEMNEVLAESFLSLQQSLGNRITMTPRELAELIVNTNASHTDFLPTLSAINLKEMKNVADSIKALGEAIEKSEDKKQIRESFTSSENYGVGYEPFNHVHDLQQSCKNLLKNSSDETVKKAAKQVIETTSKAIIANVVNEGADTVNITPYEIAHPNSTGLSIFSPVQKTGFDNFYNKLALEKDTSWLKSLKTVREQA